MKTRFPQKIILASLSPRRQELLRQIQVDFDVFEAEIDETAQHNETPHDYVVRMAVAKAENAKQTLQIEQPADPIILAADTTVTLDGEILQKPSDADHAAQMLTKLSGNTHQVMTCVAVASQEIMCHQLSTSKVTFGEISPQQIKAYIATQEGLDKAGGYAIQGIAAQFVRSIEGSYSGVVGLPLFETSQLLDQIMARSDKNSAN